jgi:ribonuclease P protein component
MLPKKLRLDTKDISHRYWKKIISPYFTLKESDNNLDNNRYAVIVSKKAAKKATRRNFWRRYFSNYFQSWPNMCRDFLIIASPNLTGADKKNVKMELDKILNRSEKNSGDWGRF